MSLLTDEEKRQLCIDWRKENGLDSHYYIDDPDSIYLPAQQAKTLKAVAEWLVLVREEIDREHPSMDSPARYGLFVARITDALPLLTEGKLPGETD